MPNAVGQDLEAVMHEPLALETRADAGLRQQVHADLLEHARANPAEHVLGALPLEQHRVHAGPVQ